jgi:CAAX protease family protein
MNRSNDSETAAGVTKLPERSAAGIGSTAGWRGSRWVAVAELGIVALIFVADWRHWIPFSKTPFILAVGWLSLWIRKVGWRGIGFGKYRSWKATLGWGLVCGLAMEALELFVNQPILVRLTGEQPDLHDFKILTGNLRYTLIALALVWTLAAFGEELVYRGYLMNRVADLGRRTRGAWIVSLILVNVAFGLAHTYQGVTGVAENFIDGALMGIMYLAARRNLAIPIIAHGIQDTVDLLLVFLGRYPGL